MNPEDFLKLLEINLAKIDKLDVNAKILSDNKITVREGNNIYNITTNIHINITQEQIEKEISESIPQVKSQLLNTFQSNPNLVNQIGLVVPQADLASYLQGTVSANASLATINPQQPTFILEPKTFEQSHKVDFVQDEKGNFKTTTLEDLLSGKTK